MESNENRKYIDSEKLIASIKRKIESIENCPFQLASLGEEKKSEGELIAYKDALSLIDSLQQEPPEADLEKASRNVYESWMGGTMDDVRRDMVELGEVLNARKEEQ